MAAEASDEDKKTIYDESFTKIKEEKYAFKLPRGVKKTKAPPAADQATGGFGGGGATGGGDAWGGGAANTGGFAAPTD